MTAIASVESFVPAAPERLLLSKDRVRFPTGLHVVATDDAAWESLLERVAHRGTRMALLSSDQPRSVVWSAPVNHYWFRSSQVPGSVRVWPTALESLLPRLVRGGALTAVEGVEVLVYWNGMHSTIRFLSAMDERLYAVRSSGLLLLRPGEMSPEHDQAVIGRFPGLPAAGEVASSVAAPQGE